MTSMTSAGRVMAPIFRGRAGLRARQVAAAASVLVLWFLVARSGLVSEGVIPRPEQVARTLWGLLGTGEYWTAVRQTLQGSVFGLAAAFSVAVPVGLLTGTYPLGERLSRLSVDIGRSFPVVALLPVFLLIFGATKTMEVAVIFTACVFPLLLQAQYGARDVTQAIKDTARSFQIRGLLRFRKVILPSALPSVMTGLRLAASISVLVAVGVEILTATPGIGRRLAAAQLDGDASQAFAYVVTAASIGFAVNRAFEAAERRFLRWRSSEGR